MRKNKETPRDFYADDSIWNAVYCAAVPDLKDAMDLAYLTGQRPADVLSMRATDIIDSFPQVAQGKTSKKLRIRLDAGEVINGLGALIERLLEQRKARRPNPLLDRHGRWSAGGCAVGPCARHQTLNARTLQSAIEMDNGANALAFMHQFEEP